MTNAHDLFHSNDCIHEQLSQKEWDEASKRLSEGAWEDTIYTLCRRWAQANAQEAEADTESALRHQDHDYCQE